LLFTWHLAFSKSVVITRYLFLFFLGLDRCSIPDILLSGSGVRNSFGTVELQQVQQQLLQVSHSLRLICWDVVTSVCRLRELLSLCHSVEAAALFLMLRWNALPPSSGSGIMSSKYPAVSGQQKRITPEFRRITFLLNVQLLPGHVISNKRALLSPYRPRPLP
jgi:hypothetical protein